ncbi:hypothetical protein DIPPA_22433 [Diplonema papillatum]|nr:hypothetical protein DIPPA_22433 [Diplonema papillatum]
MVGVSAEAALHYWMTARVRFFSCATRRLPRLRGDCGWMGSNACRRVAGGRPTTAAVASALWLTTLSVDAASVWLGFELAAAAGPRARDVNPGENGPAARRLGQRAQISCRRHPRTPRRFGGLPLGAGPAAPTF